MSKKKSPAKKIEVDIAALSERIVGPPMQPSSMFAHVLDTFVGFKDEQFAALCTAIRPDYPQWFEQYKKIGEENAVLDMHTAEKEAWFHIGVAVGRRLR
jgi:hypothetical protein